MNCINNVFVHNNHFQRRLLLLLQYKFGLIKFKLPDLGEKIKQGTIKKLYINEGQYVNEFQKIADVSSDKQFTQITASDSGIVKKIYYQQQDICQVGDLFLEIQTSQIAIQNNDNKNNQLNQKIQVNINKQAQIMKQQQINKQKQKQNKQSIISSKTQNLMTPYVRRLIKQYNLNIDTIIGSGLNGRITEYDIKECIDKKQLKQQLIKIKTQKTISKQSSKFISNNNDKVQIHKMNNFEKGMQKSMTYSNNIPHLYLHEQFDLTQSNKLRQIMKERGKKITVMGILIKTFSLALKLHPKINCTYEPELNQFSYNVHTSHNISVAIDTPNGLVVPNIKKVEELNLHEIQKQLLRLRELSELAKLTSNQLNNGTICLSNIGTIGGINACPLILSPQTCIVAIGRIQIIPKWIENSVQSRKCLQVTFGCDHRVIDGATVARFSNSWKQFVQNPSIAFTTMI